MMQQKVQTKKGKVQEDSNFDNYVIENKGQKPDLFGKASVVMQNIQPIE